MLLREIGGVGSDDMGLGGIVVEVPTPPIPLRDRCGDAWRRK